MNTLFLPDPSYLAAQWLFLALLGVVALLAFCSLPVQVEGLY